MTSANTSLSTAGFSVADVFLAHLAAGDFARFATVFDADVSFSALLPDGLHEWTGPEGVTAAFVRWFGRVDEFEILEASIGQVGPRLQLNWRARVRGGPFGAERFVVEQHLYADRGPTGLIQSMSMLCSGFAKEDSGV